MRESLLARRAAGLSTSFPAPHFPSELAPGTVAFDSGFAFPHVLPDLTKIAHEALTTHKEETLQYSAGQGQPELREWIAGYMNEDGCNLDAENILITNGAKNGLELICQLLLDEGDAIVVTAPTYFTCIPIFRKFGVEFLEVSQDKDGIVVSEIEEILAARKAAGKPKPKFIYDIADFHNPTGATMSLARRQALVDLAVREDIFLIEDTPYRRVRFENDDVPTLKALDKTGVVFHCGTFSKLIAPGLRIGWIAAEKDLIARLIQLKADGGSSPLLQRIIYEFCASGEFKAHIAKVQDAYRSHRDHIVAAVKRELPDAEVAIPEGGYYVWLTLPAGVDGDAFAKRAADAGVNIIPGSKFFATPGGYPQNSGGRKNFVRLSYSYATLEEIDDGVRRLAAVYQPVAA